MSSEAELEELLNGSPGLGSDLGLSPTRSASPSAGAESPCRSSISRRSSTSRLSYSASRAAHKRAARSRSRSRSHSSRGDLARKHHHFDTMMTRVISGVRVWSHLRRGGQKMTVTMIMRMGAIKWAATMMLATMVPQTWTIVIQIQCQCRDEQLCNRTSRGVLLPESMCRHFRRRTKRNAKLKREG